MEGNKMYPEHMVFGLDIGTRSLVGSVGYMDKDKFNVVAHVVKEHETRAMMDGQIHDIGKVSESIRIVKKELEEQIGRKLENVCIAAAGRVLKTVTVSVKVDREDDVPVSDEEIYSLELMGIEKAYEEIKRDYPDVDFYCVGYTTVKYYMNDYIINNLEGHKAKSISADILATFLPYEVVEGLYSAVNMAGLEVANLTLEPIAAINVAIPEQFRLLNIALVDVGAGTSDICITMDGSIIAYGMIPHAGDEITENIVHKCLVDFQTAEKIKRASLTKKQISYKDIMGLVQKTTAEDVRKMYKDTVDSMTAEIAAKIQELNGGKSVSAVFVVGGGGKAYGFTQGLADALNIPRERVALRGEEVLGDVTFHMDGVKKDPLLVTPIGICINYYNQKNNFIVITVNDKRIKLYNNDKLTVVDALVQSGIPNIDLFPKRGKELSFTYNGSTKVIRGEFGDAALIKVNEKNANLNTRIDKNDKISITPSIPGKDATYTVSQLADYNTKLKFYVNDKAVECPKVALVNDEQVTENYEIKEGDVVNIPDHYMLSQVMQFMDIDTTDKNVLVNGHQSVQDEPIYGEFKITFTDKTFDDYEDDSAYLSGDNSHNSENFDTNERNLSENVENNNSHNVIQAEAGGAADNNTASDNKPDDTNKNATAHGITVTINSTPVTLLNKSKYIFVDVLDVYPFDTSVAKGIDIVIKKNGAESDFTDTIEDGDILELYWE